MSAIWNVRNRMPPKNKGTAADPETLDWGQRSLVVWLHPRGGSNSSKRKKKLTQLQMKIAFLLDFVGG